MIAASGFAMLVMVLTGMTIGHSRPLAARFSCLVFGRVLLLSGVDV
jgi:hypothetical protein